MELRPGYKQTEVGIIPEEWEVVPFSELLEFRNGVNADKHAYGKGIPFINVLEVESSFRNYRLPCPRSPNRPPSPPCCPTWMRSWQDWSNGSPRPALSSRG